MVPVKTKIFGVLNIMFEKSRGYHWSLLDFKLWKRFRDVVPFSTNCVIPRVSKCVFFLPRRSKRVSVSRLSYAIKKVIRRSILVLFTFISPGRRRGTCYPCLGQCFSSCGIIHNGHLQRIQSVHQFLIAYLSKILLLISATPLRQRLLAWSKVRDQLTSQLKFTIRLPPLKSSKLERR